MHEPSPGKKCKLAASKMSNGNIQLLDVEQDKDMSVSNEDKIAAVENSQAMDNKTFDDKEQSMAVKYGDKGTDIPPPGTSCKNEGVTPAVLMGSQALHPASTQPTPFPFSF